MGVVDRRWATAAAVCGLAASLSAFLVPGIAACAWPSYSHASQYLSELGASGAPNAALVAAAGFAPTGAFVLAFVAFARAVLPPSRRETAGVLCFGVVGAAYVASAIFPCDPGCPGSGSPSQSVHNFFGLLEYVGALVGLVLLGAGLRHDLVWRPLSRACFLASVVVALGFAGMLAPALAPIRGISQRVAEAGIFAWLAYAGVRLHRLTR